MPWHLAVRLLGVASSQTRARLKLPPALRGCLAAFWGHWKQWMPEAALHGKALGLGHPGNAPTAFLPALVLVVPPGGLQARSWGLEVALVLV